jgi:hypothetical protein
LRVNGEKSADLTVTTHLHPAPQSRLVNDGHPMDATSERVRMTCDDLVALPDDGLRHELIDGVHFVTPSPALVHQLIVGSLFD